MKLSARLEAVVSLIPPGKRVADIGSDHTQLPLYLARTGHSAALIASEGHREPFYRARMAVELAGLEGKIEVRLGYGLSVLRPGEVDVVCIAGMGGTTIERILADGLETARKLETVVCQPMVAAAQLRQWLLTNGFDIFDERLAREEFVYEAFAARPRERGRDGEDTSARQGTPALQGAALQQGAAAPVLRAVDSLAELYREVARLFADNGCAGLTLETMMEVGPLSFVRRDPLLKELVAGRIRKYQDVAEGLTHQRTQNALYKLQLMRQRLIELKKVLSCLQ